MRAFVVELLRCPACYEFPLGLTTFESDGSREDSGGLDVETGFLFCPACRRFYFIHEGIPRLLTEDFPELIDLSVAERFPNAFGEHTEHLEAFVSLVSAGQPRDAESKWNLEDVAFWEDEIYSDRRMSDLILRQASVARPDAGNRAYPRERALFGRLRDEIAGGVLLDLGCGLSQTIRTLCNPETVGYSYIGADLSISALLTGRRTLRGDFVQCSADRLPFRSESVDAIVMLGTLHHLADHEDALSDALAAIQPGGWIALDEVVARPGVTRRFRMSARQSRAESAHNESVDPSTVQRCLAPSADVVVMRREYSPLRGVLAGYLAERMRTSPSLTRLVLAIDHLWLVTLGRLSPYFEGRELLILARKRGAPRMPLTARNTRRAS